MCTAIMLADKSKRRYVGRTMDFSHVIDPSLYICPRNYIIKEMNTPLEIKNQYAFIGIGQETSKVMFAEGMNEKGVAVQALYLPQYASYLTPYEAVGKEAIDSLEVVTYLLGNCKSVVDAYTKLQHITIVGTEDMITGTVSPLHWMITDISGNCLVLESRADGIHLIPNPIGVLTNSPNLEWHLTNLCNYMNVSADQCEEKQWGNVTLTPFGQGGGGFGLPGDDTSPSRFVRAAFLNSNMIPPQDPDEGVNTLFHMLDTLSIPKGSVMTSKGVCDYTQYISVMDLQRKRYYFKTYDNNQILSARMDQFDHMVDLGKLSDIHQYEPFIRGR